MLESKIQKKVCEYAKSKGWMISRFTSRSYPDRFFVRRGYDFMIEFKQEGEEPEGLQKRTIDKLRCNGKTVYVVDSIEKGFKIIDSYEF